MTAWRERRQAGVLGDVIVIQRLRRDAAEVALAAATKALEIDRRLEAERLEDLEEDQRRWLGCLAGRFDFTAARLWAAKTVVDDAQSQLARARAEEAATRSSQCAATLRTAIVHLEATERLGRHIGRRLERQDEERRLAESADTHLRREARRCG
jgi:hypothetical protein